MDLSIHHAGGGGHGYGSAALTPSSVSTATTGASPVDAPNRRLPHGRSTRDYPDFKDEDDDDGYSHDGEHPKKKQKRNKPTLSCHECVERKTKVSCRPA